MPHPSTNYLIARVRDFCRWHEKMFGDPSAHGAPLKYPPGWATDKEFWIRNTVWRETIFEGNADDSMAAADALIDHGLLRAKRMERDLEVLERTITVRVREQTFRAFVVSRSILSWKDPTPARFEEILSVRHAATMQHAASMLRSADMIMSMPSDRNSIPPDPKFSASELGEKLEQAVHMALNEVVAILGFSLNPDDRAFAAILKAKTTILTSVLNAQVRIDETRFETGKKDRLEGILAIAERSLSHLERTYGR
jgi:hypothetical protein